MKKLIFLSIIIITATWTSLSFGQKDSTMNSQPLSDTTYYNVKISVESGVTEEFMKTFIKNGKVTATVLKIFYHERNYVGQPSFRSKQDTLLLVTNLALSKSQTDTLEHFKEMILTNSIRHNQGTKFAGRRGIYTLIEHGDTISTQSIELYSLTEATRFDRR